MNELLFLGFGYYCIFCVPLLSVKMAAVFLCGAGVWRLGYCLVVVWGHRCEVVILAVVWNFFLCLLLVICVVVCKLRSLETKRQDYD